MENKKPLWVWLIPLISLLVVIGIFQLIRTPIDWGAPSDWNPNKLDLFYPFIITLSVLVLINIINIFKGGKSLKESLQNKEAIWIGIILSVILILLAMRLIGFFISIKIFGGPPV